MPYNFGNQILRHAIPGTSTGSCYFTARNVPGNPVDKLYSTLLKRKCWILPLFTSNPVISFLLFRVTSKWFIHQKLFNKCSVPTSVKRVSEYLLLVSNR